MTFKYDRRLINVLLNTCFNGKNSASGRPDFLPGAAGCPEPVFVNLVKCPGIDSQPGGFLCWNF
jgi:hypothetical protein